jgi:hypothetical protein
MSLIKVFTGLVDVDCHIIQDLSLNDIISLYHVNYGVRELLNDSYVLEVLCKKYLEENFTNFDEFIFETLTFPWSYITKLINDDNSDELTNFLNCVERFGIIFERLYQESKKRILGEAFVSKVEWDYDAKSYVDNIMGQISFNMLQAAGNNSKNVLSALINKYPSKANYFNLTLQAAKNGHKQLALDLSINNDDKNYKQLTSNFSSNDDSKNYSYCILALGFCKGRHYELLYEVLSIESNSYYWKDLSCLFMREGTSDDMLFCADVARKLRYDRLAANLACLAAWRMTL